MQINYNHQGKWSINNVIKKYKSLCELVKCIDGFELIPDTFTTPNGEITWTYNIMNSVVEGIILGDKACIQLAVDYIEDNIMSPTTGYLRERMARSLRHVDLTPYQKESLAKTFLNQLSTQSINKEFKEYIRLFKTIGINPYKKDIEIYTQSDKEYIRRAAEKLLTNTSINLDI